MAELPHAELKEQYFQDWRETDKPYHFWQFQVNGNWVDCMGHLCFFPETKYRRKPTTVRIGAVDVPVPQEVRSGYAQHVVSAIFDSNDKAQAFHEALQAAIAGGGK